MLDWAGRPHCGHSGSDASSADAHREQIPSWRWPAAFGIASISCVLLAYFPSIGGKRTVTDENDRVADHGRRKLSSCAAARMGGECQSVDCITPQLASHLRRTSSTCLAMAAAAALARCRWKRWPSGCWKTRRARYLAGLEPRRAGGQPGRVIPSRSRAGAGHRGLFPCFSAQTAGRIKPDVLSGFQQQLSEDFQRTVERFLALQTLGTESAVRMRER